MQIEQEQSSQSSQRGVRAKESIADTRKNLILSIRYGGTCKSKIFISGTEYMSLCIELFFVKYKVHVFSVIFDF